MSGFHKSYYQTSRWEQQRKRAFKRYGRECAHCGTHKNLVVHHKTYSFAMDGSKYQNYDDDELDELEILCAECHHAWHKELLSCGLEDDEQWRLLFDEEVGWKD